CKSLGFSAATPSAGGARQGVGSGLGPGRFALGSAAWVKLACRGRGRPRVVNGVKRALIALLACAVGATAGLSLASAASAPSSQPDFASLMQEVPSATA